MNVRRFFRYKRCSVKHVTNSTNSVLVYCGWATTMNESSKAISKLKEFVTKNCISTPNTRRHIKRLESSLARINCTQY